MKKQLATSNKKPGLRCVVSVAAAVYALSIPMTAFAYIGPGAGITMLGALWAVAVAIGLTVFGILLWPIRAMLRRMKSNSRTERAADKQKDSESGDDSMRVQSSAAIQPRVE